MRDNSTLELAFKWGGKFIATQKHFKKICGNYENYMALAEMVEIGVLNHSDSADMDSEQIFEKIQAAKDQFDHIQWHDSIPGRNLQQLASQIHFNEVELEILTLLAIFKNSNLLKVAGGIFGKINKQQFYYVVSQLTGIDQQAVKKAFMPDSRLMQSGILKMSPASTDFEDKYAFIRCFEDELNDAPATFDQLLGKFISPMLQYSLQMDDYQHLDEDLEYVVPYLGAALEHQVKGCNVLLYGPPGTGKTELAKTLAAHLCACLYEVKTEDEQGEPLEASDRIESYVTGSHLLAANGNNLIVFDEMEDILSVETTKKNGALSLSKVWFNRLLENNAIPTIWTSNHVEHFDKAFIRRFDIVLEMPYPNEASRIRIIRNAFSKYGFEYPWLDKLSSQVALAPSEGERVAKVTNMARSTEQAENHVKQLIKHSFKASKGYFPELDASNKLAQQVAHYDLQWINTRADIKGLVDALSISKAGKLCISGPSGSGKTQFAHYLAAKADMPLLYKSGSSLLRPYVGETEMMIASAFEEAKRKKALLLLDEADSFLSNRTNMRNAWEINLTNELLIQLERFDGLFIAASNFADCFDPASKRRLDFKLYFDYLTPAQAYQLYCQTLDEEPLCDAELQLRRLKNLTPGNFAVAKRQAQVMQQPVSNWLLLNVLEEESRNNTSSVAVKPSSKLR